MAKYRKGGDRRHRHKQETTKHLAPKAPAPRGICGAVLPRRVLCLPVPGYRMKRRKKKQPSDLVDPARAVQNSGHGRPHSTCRRSMS
eukprot:gene13673-biopygen12569